MKNGSFSVKGIALAFGLTSVVGSVACATEPATDVTDAPEAAIDSLDTADEGDSYNGWTQSVPNFFACYDWYLFPQSDQFWFQHTFTRSSGDSTRGGGGCVVNQTGTSCSSDSTCLGLAQSTYGASAYGYCYSGLCYSRPGSQSDFCTLNPNRAPGTIDKLTWNRNSTLSNSYVLGCMTKTAGPNTACGGTDTSQYMRAVMAPVYWDVCWYGDGT
jgi:hypothetical protein